MKTLHLEIITQEKKVLADDVHLVLAPSTQGQIGILPGHIGLLAKLEPGELFILKGPRLNVLAISGGLIDVHHDQVVVMADSAVRAEEISLAKAEAAKRRAEETLKQKLSDREFTLAEADLRRAVLELKVARKRRHYQPSPPL
jgi:F-type H+-transporting ATPase subunit epsilon